MRALVTIVRILVRILFLGQLALGITFWTGNALGLIPLHMVLGLALVVCLWITSVAAAIARVPVGLVVAALVWGLFVVGLGITQMELVPGPLHWVVQTAHLIVGMITIAMNERMARLTLDAARPDAA